MALEVSFSHQCIYWSGSTGFFVLILKQNPEFFLKNGTNFIHSNFSVTSHENKCSHFQPFSELR